MTRMKAYNPETDGPLPESLIEGAERFLRMKETNDAIKDYRRKVSGQTIDMGFATGKMRLNDLEEKFNPKNYDDVMALSEQLRAEGNIVDAEFLENFHVDLLAAQEDTGKFIDPNTIA